ncbi:hypothetical protein FIBSPDRAFT_965554 [Athelia psychrophila]|uniref:Uncharacterized protein n=1 Tax=Athelia psychrophila TaxID=1759441 RepID=A0A165WBJ4_9AGAM|nr:hypothetical protein FIBSPDRAFT_965554 [Fibularhizoctonia sp. CBS 109695]
MAPRDVPDSSKIVSTKRRPKKPRAPDEFVSLAPPTRSTAPQPEIFASAPIVQTIQSPPSPTPLSPATIRQPTLSFPQPSSLPPLTISPLVILDRGGENGTLTRVPSPTDSMPALASPTSSQQEATPLPLQVCEREPSTANESVFLVDEYILPTHSIVSRLLALRGAQSNQIDNSEYPASASGTDESEHISIDAPALPVQHEHGPLPQPSNRIQAEMRAAAAERRRAYAASEAPATTSLPARLGGAAVLLRHAQVPPPAAIQHVSRATTPLANSASTQAEAHAPAPSFIPVVQPASLTSAGGSTAAHSEAESLQTVLHARLFDLLEETVPLIQYGAAYIASRQTMIMHRACTRLGFQIGQRKDTPIVIDGVSVTQSHLIRYFSFGTGNMFWNSRSVYTLATRTRDFIQQIDSSSRQGYQNETMRIIGHMLDASILILPCAAGSASSANSLSRPAFEARCLRATGTTTGRG